VKNPLQSFLEVYQTFLIHSDVERETNSNFTGQRFTHHTGGPASFDGSSNSKSSSDSSQVVDPMQLGAQLLSFNESQLCSTLNLPPTRYLTIKTVLLSNPKISEIDPTEKVILKHLNTSGWVRKA
jgi:transcriptional adapter 2-beta